MKAYHIVKGYKVYGIPEIEEYGKYQNDLFYAKDGNDALQYLNKIKEICNEKTNS